MKIRMKTLCAATAATIVTASCHSAADSQQASAPVEANIQATPVKARTGTRLSQLPRAVVYRTNGNWNDHVTMNLDAAGTAPLSFPAPGDVSAQSAPLPVADGWLLDRRGGIGTNTVFLRWTWAEYHALAEAPDVATLMANIIDGARVTEVRRLPITASQARQDTAAVNAAIRAMTKRID